MKLNVFEHFCFFNQFAFLYALTPLRRENIFDRPLTTLFYLMHILFVIMHDINDNLRVLPHFYIDSVFSIQELNTFRFLSMATQNHTDSSSTIM